jgi:CheY-like chemotaxis protein
MESSSPPSDFQDEIKSALDHLYDLPFLQRSPLIARLSALASTGESASQQLRRRLIQAIESLNPEPGKTLRSPKGRLGGLVHKHYVEGLTLQEIAKEMGLSQRQVYRDLRVGQESIASIIWSQLEVAPLEPTSPIFREEVPADKQTRLIDIRQLLKHALHTVSQLASQHGVLLSHQFPEVPVSVRTSQPIAQQIFVDALSQSIQQAAPGTLTLHLSVDGDQTNLRILYHPESGKSIEANLTPTTLRMLQYLGWVSHQENQAGEEQSLLFSIRHSPSLLLVVDDNRGLEQLIARYLVGYPFQVVAAHSGGEGLRMAGELMPAVILLDIMMPEMDGWELVQRLRLSPSTSSLPVILCSVYCDPELAHSLGIDICLQKPLTREALLAALQQTGLLG